LNAADAAHVATLRHAGHETSIAHDAAQAEAAVAAVLPDLALAAWA